MYACLSLTMMTTIGEIVGRTFAAVVLLHPDAAVLELFGLNVVLFEGMMHMIDQV